MDTPCDGINLKIRDKIITYGVEEMVYISCKPTSLVRDLEVLAGRGYEVVSACAVDQFAGTLHVETICKLNRQNRKPDDYLRVEIDVDKIHEILDKEKGK